MIKLAKLKDFISSIASNLDFQIPSTKYINVFFNYFFLFIHFSFL